MSETQEEFLEDLELFVLHDEEGALGVCARAGVSPTRLVDLLSGRRKARADELHRLREAWQVQWMRAQGAERAKDEFKHLVPVRLSALEWRRVVTQCLGGDDAEGAAAADVEGFMRGCLLVVMNELQGMSAEERRLFCSRVRGMCCENERWPEGEGWVQLPPTLLQEVRERAADCWADELAGDEPVAELVERALGEWCEEAGE